MGCVAAHSAPIVTEVQVSTRSGDTEVRPLGAVCASGADAAAPAGAGSEGACPSEPRMPVLLLDRSGRGRLDWGKVGPAAPPATCTLAVTIVGARGLRKADWMGKSDPYCACEVPGKQRGGFQTKVMSRSLDPIWNYHGCVKEYSRGDSLSFAVYDKDMLKSDDLLGTASLPAAAFEGAGFDGEVPLAFAGKNVQAFLHVRIDAPDLPPDTPSTEGVLAEETFGETTASSHAPDGVMQMLGDSFSTATSKQTYILEMPSAPTGARSPLGWWCCANGA